MANASKVRFGLKNVHYAMLTEETPGVPTYGTPKPIPGAVSLGFEPQGDTTIFRADNTNYWVNTSNNGYQGDLQVAKYPDEFMEDVYGVTVSTNDKVATENANVQAKPFALLFEQDGDGDGTMFVAYNCSATRPTQEFTTTEDTIEPTTQTSTITMSPLADGRSVSWTTDTTPDSVKDNWYDEVWLADTTGVGG